MDILSEIVTQTQQTVADTRAATPLLELKRQAEDMPPPRSLAARLTPGRPAVIAEFKRKSPSKPNINLSADPVSVAKAYERGGAAAMSVLTEPHYFAGSPDDLTAIRTCFSLPLLRKDFMIDAYQFYETRALGADLVLLIARILEPSQLADFCALAHELGLEVLCEIHNEGELEKIGETPIDFLGVNCRDLQKFSTNLDHLVQMTANLPRATTWVAESGIQGPADVTRLFNAGYRLFLVGEYLMRGTDPESRLRELTHGAG